MPQPTWSDLRRFCEVDGWEQRGRTRGGIGDHFRYRKRLPDGRVLRTKASHGNGEISTGLWHRILRDQLELDNEEQFWGVLRTGRPVARGSAEPSPPARPTTPAWIVASLLRAGVREDEIRELSADEAQRRLDEIWSQPPESAS